MWEHSPDCLLIAVIRCQMLILSAKRFSASLQWLWQRAKVVLQFPSLTRAWKSKKGGKEERNSLSKKKECVLNRSPFAEAEGWGCCPGGRRANLVEVTGSSAPGTLIYICLKQTEKLPLFPRKIYLLGIQLMYEPELLSWKMSKQSIWHFCCDVRLKLRFDFEI